MKLAVISSSVRDGRATERLAKWVAREASAKHGIEVELVDLKEYPMPLFNEPESPRFNQHRQVDPTAQKWLDRLKAADAYLFVTPEYDHSIPGVLKNAIDYVAWEMAKKPATAAAHGTVGGARAIMHLKEIISESRAVPTPTQLAVVAMTSKIDADGNLAESEAAAPYGLRVRLGILLDELTWYSDALATARHQTN